MLRHNAFVISGSIAFSFALLLIIEIEVIEEVLEGVQAEAVDNTPANYEQATSEAAPMTAMQRTPKYTKMGDSDEPPIFVFIA